MIKKLGEKFTNIYLKYMPNAFVFALLLTVFIGLAAVVWTPSSPLEIIKSWYGGFFDILAFAMQIVLIIITGFSIALSPLVKRGIDKLSLYIKTPNQVYFLVVLIGMLLSLISFGWLVITAVLARELALRVKGINYPFLIACVYFSFNSWVFGLSSSIPLLLNSENNFLIQKGLLSDVIPTTYTLLSSLNIAMIVVYVVIAPLVMFLLRPRSSKGRELSDLLTTSVSSESNTIKEEANSLKLPFKSWSDSLNNSILLQMVIVAMGFTYIVYHFSTKGLDLNFNIMIFIFLMVGMLLHKTPTRYVISMKRSSQNISGVLYQYPFYAGIMGIMLYTGLGEQLAQQMASVATAKTYPFFAYLAGGFVNFAIPSAGGEFAVVGPSLIEAIKELGSGQSDSEITAMISRGSLSMAYGESLSNMLQPFFLLIVMPIMGKGVNLQARDIMGYLVIPFVLFFIIQSLMVVYWPM
jgi:short-chain fatty acids transporter